MYANKNYIAVSAEALQWIVNKNIYQNIYQLFLKLFSLMCNPLPLFFRA